MLVDRVDCHRDGRRRVGGRIGQDILGRLPGKTCAAVRASLDGVGQPGDVGRDVGRGRSIRRGRFGRVHAHIGGIGWLQDIGQARNITGLHHVGRGRRIWHGRTQPWSIAVRVWSHARVRAAGFWSACQVGAKSVVGQGVGPTVAEDDDRLQDYRNGSGGLACRNRDRLWRTRDIDPAKRGAHIEGI